GLGPCTVDSDELGIVSQRLDHGVRVMSAPCLVEPQFNFADRFFICLSHGPSVDFHHRHPATHSFYGKVISLMSAMGQKRTHAPQQTASYSITSSARSRSARGISSFRAFAVFKLITI